MAGLQLPYSYDPTNPISIDIRYGKQVISGGIPKTIPFSDLTEAELIIPFSLRYPGLPIMVDAGAGKIAEYYWNEVLEAFEMKTVGAAFTEIIENAYGTHPPFTNQHDFNIWILQNGGGGGSTPPEGDPVTYMAPDYVAPDYVL